MGCYLILLQLLRLGPGAVEPTTYLLGSERDLVSRQFGRRTFEDAQWALTTQEVHVDPSHLVVTELDVARSPTVVGRGVLDTLLDRRYLLGHDGSLPFGEDTGLRSSSRC